MISNLTYDFRPICAPLSSSTLYSTSHVYTTQNCISIGARRDNNLIEEDDTSLKLHGVISFLFGF